VYESRYHQRNFGLGGTFVFGCVRTSRPSSFLAFIFHPRDGTMDDSSDDSVLAFTLSTAPATPCSRFIHAKEERVRDDLGSHRLR
jgi:hypothetical protein